MKSYTMFAVLPPAVCMALWAASGHFAGSSLVGSQEGQPRQEVGAEPLTPAQLRVQPLWFPSLEFCARTEGERPPGMSMVDTVLRDILQDRRIALRVLGGATDVGPEGVIARYDWRGRLLDWGLEGEADIHEMQRDIGPDGAGLSEWATTRVEEYAWGADGLSSGEVSVFLFGELDWEAALTCQDGQVVRLDVGESDGAGIADYVWHGEPAMADVWGGLPVEAVVDPGSVSWGLHLPLWGFGGYYDEVKRREMGSTTSFVLSEGGEFRVKALAGSPSGGGTPDQLTMESNFARQGRETTYFEVLLCDGVRVITRLTASDSGHRFVRALWKGRLLSSLELGDGDAVEVKVDLVSETWGEGGVSRASALPDSVEYVVEAAGAESYRLRFVLESLRLDGSAFGERSTLTWSLGGASDWVGIEQMRLCNSEGRRPAGR